MDLELLASNIRRFRNDRRFTQGKLAERAELSIATVKKLETAVCPPRIKTITAIAEALEINMRDLFSSIRPLQAVRFRSFKRIRIRESILADVSRWLDDFNFLEEALSETRPYALHKLQLSDLATRGAEQVAMDCREDLGLDDMQPICNIADLLESAGIKVRLMRRESEQFFGLSVGGESGGPAVVVNTRKKITPERQIFTAAHELAHLLLHLEAFDVSREEEDKEQEHEANVFAGHFLMPQAGFDHEWRNAAGLYWVDRVLKVKRLFRVSYKTVLTRLIDLGMTDNGIWPRFYVAYQHKYHRKLAFKDEPQETGPEPVHLASLDFVEDRLSGLVRKALEKNLISMSRGAEILGIGSVEMQSLSHEWETMP